MSKQVALLDSLFDLRLQHCQDMEDYVQKFGTLQAQLATIECAVDEKLAVLLLRGLTDEYRPFRMALETVSTELKYNTVKERLVAEGHRRKTESKNSGGVAYAAKQQGGDSKSPGAADADKRKKSNFDIKKARCYKCKEFGHFKANCPQKGNGSGGAEKTEDKDQAKRSWLTALSCDVERSKWYLDSGANTHMTRDIKNFSSLVEGANEQETVSTANNGAMSVDGIGRVPLKLDKGMDVLVENVRLVPDLSANLLSISKMVQKGTAVLFDRTGCQLFDGNSLKVSGEVLGTASEINGLYCLNLESQGTS